MSLEAVMRRLKPQRHWLAWQMHLDINDYDLVRPSRKQQRRNRRNCTTGLWNAMIL